MLFQRLSIPSSLRSSISSLSLKASSSTFTLSPRCSYSTSSSQPKKISDPLRILFCGSDVFSCYSLKALHGELKSNPNGLIKSIDVMVRPGKAVGRGYKEIRQVPIQELAEELSLPIHVRDTFTGWNLPRTADGEPINLIIAVSFGLFVPPRILGQAKYGGLNVHPSLLPDLRGPAPLHHALLHRLSHTGVSVQTLSPQTFDAGTVIAQTPLPGIPIPEGCTVPQLHDLLAPLGASMLVSSLQQGLHIPPLVPVVNNSVPTSGILPDGRTLKHAPKITKADQHLSFWAAQRDSNPAAAAALKARIYPGNTLWTNVLLSKQASKNVDTNKSKTFDKKRIILEEISEVPVPKKSAEGGNDELLQKVQNCHTYACAMNSFTSGDNIFDRGQRWWKAPDQADCWYVKFAEEEEVKEEVEATDGKAGEKVTTTVKKPRVIWAVATKLGLDDAKEEDKGAVTFVMGSPSGFGLLRVGKIKMEGSKSKPARQVVINELAVQAA
ncbi:Formyltransferase [Sordaria brevicollis]|uniref:methionyl-tRNA formyltransferase n=1 Tax=Sordaria brevicollis TaxID=83679 RepID=A0AAE0P2T3_SORBR|nr:Formyltransferase [Sordaria brevicollis]